MMQLKFFRFIHKVLENLRERVLLKCYNKVIFECLKLTINCLILLKIKLHGC